MKPGLGLGLGRQNRGQGEGCNEPERLWQVVEIVDGSALRVRVPVDGWASEVI